MSLNKRIRASMNVSFKGVNELSVALTDFSNMDLVKEAVLLNGAELQEKAQRKAPVDTGHLKRSIGLSSDIASRGLKVHVYANADYAGYVEFGTRYQYGQAFMRPSFNEQKKKFKADLARLMK